MTKPIMHDMFGTPIKPGNKIIFAASFGSHLYTSIVVDVDVPYAGRSKGLTDRGIRVEMHGYNDKPTKKVLPYDPMKYFVLPEKE